MYIYTRPRSVPRRRLSGLGTTQEQPQEAPVQEQASTGQQGRYTPARNIDPATGLPIATQQHPAPWAVVDVSLDQINCRFYENAPREMVLPETLPYTMEISGPGYGFIGACHPSQQCPQEVHEGARPGDPLRESRCSQWLTQWTDEAPAVIASEEFRRELTDAVLNIANVTGARRSLAKPAEFLEIIYEREARERPIRMFAFVVLAGSAGILTFQAVRSAVKKRAKKKAKKKKKAEKKIKG